MKPKKIPMRMCVGCREMKPKKELIRIVRNTLEQKVMLDRTSKAPGRGAYLCGNQACLQRAIKTRALERALEEKIEDAVYKQLTEELDQIALRKEKMQHMTR